MSDTSTTTTTDNVTLERVKECEVSANFWSTKIAPYGARMGRRAEYFEIAAVFLSAVTALGVWKTLQNSDNLVVVIIVSSVSVLAALSAAIPRIRPYAACDKAAASLGPQYGHVLGALIDARVKLEKNEPEGQDCANEAVKKFEEIKKGKDALRPYPSDLQKEIDEQRRIAKIQRSSVALPS